MKISIDIAYKNIETFNWSSMAYVMKIRNQKSAFTRNYLSSFEFITPAFWYSPTLLSKKFVFPCREIISIQSKGFLLLYTLGTPKATINLSATHSIYCVISLLLMPIKSLGKLSEINFFSMVTASLMMPWIISGRSLFLRRE